MSITYQVTVKPHGTYWMLNGHLHRIDGPAVEYANGDKVWYQNGRRHREDGPAIEYADGSKMWWQNDKRHREDGPAIEYADGAKSWFLNDVYLTEAEFNARMNPAKELTLVEIEKLLGYNIKIIG